MTKRLLHDDWSRLGWRGTSYDLKDDGNTVVMYADNDLKRTRYYRIAEVYAQLVQDAYARGLKQLPLY